MHSWGMGGCHIKEVYHHGSAGPMVIGTPPQLTTPPRLLTTLHNVAQNFTTVYNCLQLLTIPDNRLWPFATPHHS